MNYSIEPNVRRSATLLYPVLMRGVGSGDQPVVLFINSCEGHRLTEFGFRGKEDGWISAEDKGQWERFEGTIRVIA